MLNCHENIISKLKSALSVPAIKKDVDQLFDNLLKSYDSCYDKYEDHLNNFFNKAIIFTEKNFGTENSLHKILYKSSTTLVVGSLIAGNIGHEAIEATTDAMRDVLGIDNYQ